MTKHFQNEIEKLKKKILHLTAVVEQSLRMAVTAVTENDTTLASKVIDGDEDVDAHEVEVEEECLKILALHQPVAVDLRYVIAVLKINSDIERIGDLAVNIAERARDLAPIRANNKMPFDLASMCTLTQRMVKDSVDSLVQSDPATARKVMNDDNEIDDRHRQAFQTVTEQIKAQPDKVAYFLNLLSVSRYLERIADHATNIAEDVIYMVEGEIVRHQGS